MSDTDRYRVVSIQFWITEGQTVASLLNDDPFEPPVAEGVGETPDLAVQDLFADITFNNL